MSFKRKPAGSLDSMSSDMPVGSSDIDAFGGMLVNVGELLQKVATGSSGGSSDS